MNETYWEEFDLNIINQIKNPKEILKVGYWMENVYLFMIIIPKGKMIIQLNK